ncbi:MAG: TetR/AcrR family transcriptional regulator [Kiritimatiellia bacterium]
MSGRNPAWDRILDAAERIVLERGASHMSMDAIAARAGISKGGLMYHFPSQKSLLRAMLERFIARVEKSRMKRLAKLPPSSVRHLKAYLLTWLSLGAAARRSASALLASATREPEMMALVKHRHRQVWAEFLQGLQNPQRAVILALAGEGMWMAELLDVSALSRKERREVRQNLLRLIEEWCGATDASQKVQSGEKKNRTSSRRHTKSDRKIG